MLVLDVGRGSCGIQNDLVEALRSERIAGAALDVFETERLPKESPPWHLPNVLITLHIAGTIPGLGRRRLERLIENRRRFRDGLQLRNVVDKGGWF